MQLSFTRLQLSIWLILAALLVFTQATSIPHPLRPRGNTRPGYPCSTNTDCELGLCDVFGNCATVCKLLALDQTCSGDDRECDQGVCGFDYSTPGRRMCALAADGDQCGRNADCASSSHCFNPQPGWVSAYEICLQDAQCGTNRCETDPDPDYAYVCRPYGKRCEFVKTCTISELGGACRLAADCDSMGCNGGTCSPTPVGGQCVTPIECRTNLCINGTCSARFGGDSCSLNDDCRSGICTIIQDDYGRCAKVAAGSTCLSNRDCLSNVCDLSHNTCLLPVGASCPLASACGSGICQNSVCSALPAKALCSANEDCISGNCGPEQPGCEGPRGCYSARSCQPSAIGSPCTVDTDCSKPGWCQGSQPFKTTGTCVAGTRPADDPTTSTIPSSTSTSTTTSATSSTTSSTTTTSATSSRRSTHDHKLADDHYAQLQFLDAHLNQEHDHHPQALGGHCSSGYCRKGLKSDGVARNDTGACDTKKASGAWCYQNGGCISGTCNKTQGVCT
ncbi:hypothetical protein V8E36_008469 [Tilletia maclaganii]